METFVGNSWKRILWSEGKVLAYWRFDDSIGYVSVLLYVAVDDVAARIVVHAFLLVTLHSGFINPYSGEHGLGMRYESRDK